MGAIFNESFRTRGHYWDMVFSLFRRLAASRSERRQEPRGTRIEGQISLDGRNYPLKDWSRRGFSAVGVGTLLYPGDKVTVSVEIDLEGEQLTFDCSAVVVWVERERKEVAAVFTELDMRVQERIMRQIFAQTADERQLGPPLHA